MPKNKVINPICLVWKNGYKHYCLAGYSYTHDVILYEKLKMKSKRRSYGSKTYKCSSGGIRVCLKKLK